MTFARQITGWTSPGRLRSLLSQVWRRCLRLEPRVSKSLRLYETLPLGDRRFLAVVGVGSERFLVAGTANSLVLLSRLDDSTHQPPLAEETAAPAEARALPILHRVTQPC